MYLSLEQILILLSETGFRFHSDRRCCRCHQLLYFQFHHVKSTTFTQWTLTCLCFIFSHKNQIFILLEKYQKYFIAITDKFSFTHLLHYKMSVIFILNAPLSQLNKLCVHTQKKNYQSIPYQ